MRVIECLDSIDIVSRKTDFDQLFDTQSASYSNRIRIVDPMAYNVYCPIFRK